MVGNQTSVIDDEVGDGRWVFSSEDVKKILITGGLMNMLCEAERVN